MPALLSLLLTAGLLFAPPAGAAEALHWDFSTQGLANWSLTQEMNLQKTSAGLVLQASADTAMLWKLPSNTKIDSFTLLAAADRPTTISILWHPTSAPEGKYQQIPANIVAGTNPEAVTISLSDIANFDPNIDQFGFKVPAGSVLLFKDLTFERTKAAEKLGLWWQGFWTFDELTMRSINFLWGPRLATSNASLQTLYKTEPAGGTTANWLFYGIVVLGLGWGWKKAHDGHAKAAAATVLIVIAGSWLLYDLRMSAELFSYAKTDYDQWVSAPADSRTFRESDDAFRVLEALPPLLQKEPAYALLSAEGFSPNFFRYATYPSLPVTGSGAQATLRDWVVFHRPDIAIANGSLIDTTGTVLTPPGEVVKRFSDHSFLFRVTKP